MIPRSPSLFQIEEGAADQQATAPLPASGELVGLRLIIQPSSAPRQQRHHRPPLAVLRRSSCTPAASASSSNCQLNQSGGARGLVGLEFLKCCLSCRRKIDAAMDVFVYKGEQAFCSAECRCRQIAAEERREIEALVRKRRDAFHSRRAAPAGKIGGPSDRHARVQISSFC